MPTELLRATDTVVIPAGSYVMGAALDDKFATDTERPARRVVFARPFGLGRHAVTVAEYQAFAPEHGRDEDPTLPVVNVSWREARAYCAWLAREHREPFRLPSEAEWEYACRAGGRGPFATGEDIEPAAANFLYSETGGRIGPGRRLPVGSYPPNALGLFDMHGNVCEWVEDSWHPSYAGAPGDGTVWITGPAPRLRVVRGGAWDHLPRLLRCAWRDALPEDARRDNVGFRVALTLPEP